STDAAVVAAGLVVGVRAGTTTITATDASGVSQSVLLTVTPALLASIAITPADASVPLDTTKQLTATGTYTDGSTLDITQSVSWASDQTVAVSNAPAGGVVTAIGPGAPATITATD